MIDFTQWNEADFATLCRDILAGLGMAKASRFSAEGIAKAFRIALVRESSDGMFRTEEKWLCIFQRANQPLDAQQIQPFVQASVAADVNYLLTVIFGQLTDEAEALLREKLAQEKVHVVLLSGVLAETLAVDYGQAEALRDVSASSGFYFARLRQAARAQVEEAPSRNRFQTISIQPSRVQPLHAEEIIVAEADLPGPLQDGSFLLLGDPGTGKTTSLLMLGQMLAQKGALTPLFLPLGRYQGDFWQMMGNALACGGQAISQEIAQKVLRSGGLVLLLDGINEVQELDLQAQLLETLNELTEPGTSTAQSRWIVSGRVHDYERNRHTLIHLEGQCWEMQPLMPDLIYKFLVSGLGKVQAQIFYDDLGENVLDICGNPLLLDMLLTLYQETEHTPIRRVVLYNNFVELLFSWNYEHGGKSQHQVLNNLLYTPLTKKKYKELILEVLTMIATLISNTTIIGWDKACQHIASILTNTSDPSKVAKLLLKELTNSGLLQCRGTYNQISFFHHSFREYFQAQKMTGYAVEDLIQKEGVVIIPRETVLFVAGLVSDPTPFVQRALEIDNLPLAFEFVRESSQVIKSELKYQLAEKLWKHAVDVGSYVGANRFWALLFRRLAMLLSTTVETLASQIDSSLSETEQTRRLIQFFIEIGDTKTCYRIFKSIETSKDILEEFLWQAAQCAYYSSEWKKAVKLYSNYLEKNPDDLMAINSRGLAYYQYGCKEEAQADFESAVKLGHENDKNSAEKNSPLAVSRYNLAILLYDLGEEKETEDQIHLEFEYHPTGIPIQSFKEAVEHQIWLALEDDPTYAPAHSWQADWLQSEEPDKALWHREQAVRYAAHNDDLYLFMCKLADLQEELGFYTQAKCSLRKLIALDPTSSQRHLWKKRITQLKQKQEAEARTYSVHDSLEKGSQGSLITLAMDWLRMAGLTVKETKPKWLLAKGRRVEGSLPIILMPELEVSAKGLREVRDFLPREARQAKQLMLVTAVETLSLAARYQLAALQEEQKIALVTALEVRDALLLGNREARQLLDRALARAGRLGNPFAYKGVVRETTEFFGREQELNELVELIGRGQQVGLYGIHKIGKSSLLEQLRRKLHLASPEISVVEIELNASLSDASDFYLEVLEKLPSWTEIPQNKQVSAKVFRQTLRFFHIK